MHDDQTGFDKEAGSPVLGNDTKFDHNKPRSVPCSNVPGIFRYNQTLNCLKHSTNVQIATDQNAFLKLLIIPEGRIISIYKTLKRLYWPKSSSLIDRCRASLPVFCPLQNHFKSFPRQAFVPRHQIRAHYLFIKFRYVCAGPRRADNAGAKRAILYYGVEYFISLPKECGGDAGCRCRFVCTE